MIELIQDKEAEEVKANLETKPWFLDVTLVLREASATLDSKALSCCVTKLGAPPLFVVQSVNELPKQQLLGHSGLTQAP